VKDTRQQDLDLDDSVDNEKISREAKPHSSSSRIVALAALACELCVQALAQPERAPQEKARLLSRLAAVQSQMGLPLTHSDTGWYTPGDEDLPGQGESDGT